MEVGQHMGRAEDTAAWSGSFKYTGVLQAYAEAPRYEKHKTTKSVWISCNFYCTFLFGLATTFHLFEFLRPQSRPNTQHSSQEWDKVAQSNWSQVRFPLWVRLEALGGHTGRWSVTEGNFSPDLCVDCITHKPNHCVEQDQRGRDSSDIMEGTRKYSREQWNLLDPTLMCSPNTPFRILRLYEPSILLCSLKSPPNKHTSPDHTNT